ncbi:MAG: hypothetical protein HC767_07750 [Akkermansiaceae bacterium]|nr:hypothetical protein [Akkermansiaceae bacterium]
MLYVHAAKAALSANQEKGQLVLKLQDAYTETRDARAKYRWASQEKQSLLF